MLGFASHPERTAEAGVWDQYITVRISFLPKSDGQSGVFHDAWRTVHLAPGPAWLSSSSTQLKTHSDTRPRSNTVEGSRPPSIHETLEFSDDEMSHIAFLLRIVVAVSWLAFTN